MNYYSESIQTLIEELSGLPNIGPKSAQRLAFHILNLPEKRVEHWQTVFSMRERKFAFVKNALICPTMSCVRFAAMKSGIPLRLW